MADIKELKENDLKQVTGGANITFNSLNKGDVFISKGNEKLGALIMEDVDLTTNPNALIKVKEIDSRSGKWEFYNNIEVTINAELFFMQNYYSYPLSGKTGLI